MTFLCASALVFLMRFLPLSTSQTRTNSPFSVFLSFLAEEEESQKGIVDVGAPPFDLKSGVNCRYTVLELGVFRT